MIQTPGCEVLCKSEETANTMIVDRRKPYQNIGTKTITTLQPQDIFNDNRGANNWEKSDFF